MKANFILFIFNLSILFQVNAATKCSTDSISKTTQEPVYTVIEQMPQFPGGEKELLKFIANNIKYPVVAQEKGIQGRVIVRFVVSKTGQVDRVEVIRSLDSDCDKEAVRVIKLLPKFIPGKQNGENVAVWYTLPITYKLTIDNKNENNEKIYQVIEQMPLFPGGDKEMLNFISRNIKYPVSAFRNGIQGKVILRFVVSKTGKVVRVEVIRSLSPECDKEAIRVIELLPDFIPGKLNGENVSVWYTMPITFKLQ